MFGMSGGPYTDTTRPGMTGGRPGVHVSLDDAALVRELQRAPERSKKLFRIALWKAAQLIRRFIVDGIRKPPKTGRWYKRGKSVKHRASAKGEWPAADTGNLMRGIQQNRAQEGADEAVDIVSTAAQSAALEYKPPERGGRPFMSRGFDAKVEEATEVVKHELQNIFPEYPA